MVKLRLSACAALLAASLVTAEVFAAGAEMPMDPANIEPGNISSLQRGARNFMNYCSGCHSAKYVRWNTIGEKLGLTEEQLIENLMFNAEKSHETIRSAMRPEDAERWFGVVPPDMSLIARSKGADYIYNFLRGFYVEEASPTGVNNLYLAGTSMPHVLSSLQGYQAASFSEHDAGDGTMTVEFDGFEQLTDGVLNAEEYDEFVRDTVNFLAYIAEPIRAERRKLGTWVIIYLLIFLVIARMLKKQIWKDVT